MSTIKKQVEVHAIVPSTGMHINLMSTRETQFMQKQNMKNHKKDEIKRMKKEGIKQFGVNYDSRQPDASYAWKAYAQMK